MATHRLPPVPLPRSRCLLINIALAGVLVVLTAAAAPALLTTVACEVHLISQVLGELIGWQLYWIAVVTVIQWLHPRALTMPNTLCAVIVTIVGAVVPVLAVLAVFRAVG